MEEKSYLKVIMQKFKKIIEVKTASSLGSNLKTTAKLYANLIKLFLKILD